MIIGVTGATLTTSLVGNNPNLLKAVSEFSFALGLGATGTMIGLHLIGFVAFAIVGWLMLELLRQLYESKHISEQSIKGDAMWLLFGIVNSIGLVFEEYGGSPAVSSRLRSISSLAPSCFVFSAFRGGRTKGAPTAPATRLCTRQTQRTALRYPRQILAHRRQHPDDRRTGFATTTVEPHEFFDFVTGKLERRFIDTGRTLDLRIEQMDLAPDRDGQFRVTEFFCHDDTWKITLARLADDSDAVLMDLRGFSQANDGCVFEIHELFNVVPLARAVFVVDESTDQPFMRETMQRAWRQMKDRSPNRRLEPPRSHSSGLVPPQGCTICSMRYQRRGRGATGRSSLAVIKPARPLPCYF